MKKTMLEKASTKREIKAAINSIGPLAKGALSLVRKTCGKPPACDLCGGELEGFKVEERSVRVAVPAHYRNLHYVVWTGWCAKCNRQVKERVPGVLPRFAASNSLLAQNVMDRYVYGMTVGTISARTSLIIRGRCDAIELRGEHIPLVGFNRLRLKADGVGAGNVRSRGSAHCRTV